jgi:hypothetical protein
MELSEASTGALGGAAPGRIVIELPIERNQFATVRDIKWVPRVAVLRRSQTHGLANLANPVEHGLILVQIASMRSPSANDVAT